jgi:pimeloyl-ACP methyl ester carboxylesterase
MAETPETHYVKSDDVHIAYQVLGDGPFDLLFVPGFISNVEALWRSPDQSAFFRRLASFCRLILFDKRGTGMSDRGAHDFTLEQRMHDVQAILDAIGCKQAALFGVSEGGPMSLLYAATYPQRTSALVIRLLRQAVPGSRLPLRLGRPAMATCTRGHRKKLGVSAIAEHWDANGRYRRRPAQGGSHRSVLSSIRESRSGSRDHANEPRHRRSAHSICRPCADAHNT